MSFNLTVDEVKKILQVTVENVDESTDPPTVAPLDLTNATVTLQYSIGNIFRENVQGNVKEVIMNILDAINGICSYAFAPGDLDPPSDFGFTGQFQYILKISFSDGRLFYSNNIGQLTIKNVVGS